MQYTKDTCNILQKSLPKGWHKERYLYFQVKRKGAYYVPIVVFQCSWNGKQCYKSFHVKSSGGILAAWHDARNYRDVVLKVLAETDPREQYRPRLAKTKSPASTKTNDLPSGVYYHKATSSYQITWTEPTTGKRHSKRFSAAVYGENARDRAIKQRREIEENILLYGTSFMNDECQMQVILPSFIAGVRPAIHVFTHF